MNCYHVDLHVHTTASSDGRSTLEQQVSAARKAGLHAIAVTDHNRCTPVPQEMDGVLLIPGCELSAQCGHILGLFLEWPIDFDALGHMPAGEEAVAAIRACGGLAVLAHPFQNPARIEEELPQDVDGIECKNARGDLKRANANAMAEELATRRTLAMTGGSDAHHCNEVGYAYTRVYAEALTVSALHDALVCRRCEPVLQRSTSYTQKGLSQWESARKKSFPRKAKGILYLCRNICKDLIPRQTR